MDMLVRHGWFLFVIRIGKINPISIENVGLQQKRKHRNMREILLPRKQEILIWQWILLSIFI